MAVNGTFRFHNIGQGLFYSGILSKRENQKHETFSFVYDCGTESNKKFLEREIDDFKLLLPNKKSSYKKKLDLLVVSHLHDDHVNGLEYLLKDFDVETVVMPYTSEDLRLMSRIESDGEEEFLQAFYTDPVYWFISNGVRRVLLLGSEGREQNSDNRRHRYIENNEMYVENQSILDSETINDAEVFYLKKESKITYNGFWWEFLFENLPLPSGSGKVFTSVVEDFKNRKNLTLEQIFKSKSLTLLLKKELDTQIKGMKDKINRTSVVMLHRPQNDGSCIVSNIGATCFHNNRDIFYICNMLDRVDRCTNMSSLLTGDLTIEGKEMPINLLKSKGMLNPCNRHLMLQYPHHGSKENEIEVFANLCAFVNVISCGINNKYGHPHASVIEKLDNCILVNERNAFDYTVSILQE